MSTRKRTTGMEKPGTSMAALPTRYGLLTSTANSMATRKGMERRNRRNRISGVVQSSSPTWATDTPSSVCRF